MIYDQGENVEAMSPFSKFGQQSSERKRQLSIIDEINDENLVFEDSNELSRLSIIENVYDSSHVTQITQQVVCPPARKRRRKRRSCANHCHSAWRCYYRPFRRQRAPRSSPPSPGPAPSRHWTRSTNRSCGRGCAPSRTSNRTCEVRYVQ